FRRAVLCAADLPSCARGIFGGRRKRIGDAAAGIFPGAEVRFAVIARSAATKQSSLSLQPWIASRSLSSGGHSPDPLARSNDGDHAAIKNSLSSFAVTSGFSSGKKCPESTGEPVTLVAQLFQLSSG